MRTHLCRSLAAAFALMLCGRAPAQWSPIAGQWGKTDARDLRVMAWNVEDALCSSNAKTEGANNWTAVARIVALFQPDVLLVEEAGDNTGNGTGGGVDSVSQLTTTVDLFLHGGTDIFNTGPVTAWVQKYAPGYDLPYVVVSTVSDGFNRNIILSRYPFADLNGDGVATVVDIAVNPTAYAPGGNGGIRGFLMAEINLPNANYWGDLVVGCSHLRSGFESADFAERLASAQNIAYFIDAYFNGLGSVIANPGGFVTSPSGALGALNPRTPVIWGGDWNEDEQTNGRKGPAEWMTMAATLGGTDGTDRDRTDSRYDDARDQFNNSRATFVSGSTKADYLAWQDSIAVQRRAWTFLSSAMVSAGAATPAALVGYAGSISSLSTTAADHRPILSDFILPPPCPGDYDGNGIVQPSDVAGFVSRWFLDLNAGQLNTDFNHDGVITPADVAAFVTAWNASLNGC